METMNQAVQSSKGMLWAGRIITTLSALFMVFDGVVHALRIPAVTQAFTQMGYSLSVILPLAITELICVALYLFPRTSILGAVLLTGYLGGAVDSNVRAGMPLFSFILAPVYVAILLWLGLWLRDSRLRALTPLKK